MLDKVEMDKVYEIKKDLMEYNRKFNEKTENFNPEYNIKDELDEKYHDEIQGNVLQSLKFFLFNEEKSFVWRRERIKNLIEKTVETIDDPERRKTISAILENEFDKDIVIFSYKNGIYYFKFPELTSFQQDIKQKANNFIDIPIQEEIEKAIEKYQRKHGNFDLLNEYTIVFLHHYTEKNSERIDTDNYNIKKAIDALNGRLLRNDAVKNSHICQFAVPDENAFTEMVIFPSHDIGKIFLKFIEQIRPENAAFSD